MTRWNPRFQRILQPKGDIFTGKIISAEALVCEKNAEIGQGYLFSNPVAVTGFEQLLFNDSLLQKIKLKYLRMYGGKISC